MESFERKRFLNVSKFEKELHVPYDKNKQIAHTALAESKTCRSMSEHMETIAFFILLVKLKKKTKNIE